MLKATDSHITRSRDDVIFTANYNIGGFKVRVKIRSNSYDFQSYAIVEVWNKDLLKWNRLESIHYSDMKTPAGLNYQPKSVVLDSQFVDDTNALVKMAEGLLS